MSASRPLNILITGGARGIGRGLTRHFLAGRNNVLVLDSNDEELERLREMSLTPPKMPGHLNAWHSDLANRTKLQSDVEEAAELFAGKLDVLINNAAATPHIWPEDMVMEAPSSVIMAEWDHKITVGLTAPFMLSRLCVPMLCEGGKDMASGCIINISSTRAYQSELNHEGYSASKAGLIGLTLSMAVSLGHRHKIRVNVIVPGWINVENENKRADEEGRTWEEGLSKEDMEWHQLAVSAK